MLFLLWEKPERESKFRFLQHAECENADFVDHYKPRLKVIVFHIFPKIVKNRTLAREVLQTKKKGAQSRTRSPFSRKKRPRLERHRGARIEPRPVKRLSPENDGRSWDAGSRFGPTFLALLGNDDGSFSTNSLKLYDYVLTLIYDHLITSMNTCLGKA